MHDWLQVRRLRMFARISRVSRWFESRYSSLGRVVAGAALVAAIFALDPGRTLAFEFAAILVALLVVSMLAGLRWRPRITLSRDLPDTVTTGVAAHYVLRITNTGRRTERDLVITDRLHTREPDLAAFRDASDAATVDGLNWFDRRVGFPRWLTLLRRGRGAHIEPLVIDELAPGDTLRLEVPLTAQRRGKLVFQHVELKRPDPFAVFYAIRRIPCVGETVALPPRYPIPRLHARSRRHFHLGGMTLAATVGDAEEFVGLREYRPGDPLRHIHWRGFARRGVPVIKEHQDEYFDRHALLLDTYAPHSSDDEFDALVAAAASFIEADHPRDSLLDLVFIDDRIWRLTSGRALADTRQILLQLAELQPARDDRFATLKTWFAAYAPQLASVVMLSAHWDEQRLEFVADARRRGLDTIALNVTGMAPESGDSVVPSTIRPNNLAHDLAAFATAHGVTR